MRPILGIGGERKQVTVLFADLKGSLELLADRNPEESRQLLDPVLERMMAAVHRYEGTVNAALAPAPRSALRPSPEEPELIKNAERPGQLC